MGCAAGHRLNRGRTGNCNHCEQRDAALHRSWNEVEEMPQLCNLNLQLLVGPNARLCRLLWNRLASTRFLLLKLLLLG